MGKIISQAILKTNIPIEDAIKEVFQKGCLILLNSIMIVTKELIIKKEENSRFDYSPELMFDDKVFDKAFWDKISLL
jgi:phosphoribosylglycinamide formyltransferase-1